MVFAWAKASRGDGVGDEDGAFEAGTAQVVFECEKVDVDTVGDEAEPESIVKGESALDEVVVAMHLQGATVAEVGDHGEAVADGGFELIQAGVAMTCGHGDAVVGEELGDVVVGVVFGGEGDESGAAGGGVEEAFHVLEVGGLDGVWRMGANVAGFRGDERALKVKARDHLAGKAVFFQKANDSLEAGLHGGDGVRNEGKENCVHAVLSEALAGVMEGVCGEAVRVEVGACVAVDLNIKGFHAAIGADATRQGKSKVAPESYLAGILMRSRTSFRRRGPGVHGGS